MQQMLLIEMNTVLLGGTGIQDIALNGFYFYDLKTALQLMPV